MVAVSQQPTSTQRFTEEPPPPPPADKRRVHSVINPLTSGVIVELSAIKKAVSPPSSTLLR